MIYCDPPYLITTGSYNDGNRGFQDWNREKELQLLVFWIGQMKEISGLPFPTCWSIRARLTSCCWPGASGTG